MSSRNVYIIAGPNGSGKTTFAATFLPSYVTCTNFVNADLIAKGLSPFSPSSAAIKAGKLVLQQIREFMDRGADFAFETTLAGVSYARLLRDLKDRGYAIHLFFLWIPHTRLALARIRNRVAAGGHDVPAADVKRRFRRSVTNFMTLYKPLLSSWMLFNNAGHRPILVAECRDEQTLIADPVIWQQVLRSLRG
jgi:predicted ABC-type ATPase